MAATRTPEMLTAVHRARLLAERELRAPSGAGESDMRHEESDGVLLTLAIDEIDDYEHNPRVGRNPRYDELKASIRADGITNPITVTRRNAHAKYTPYGGGNTRLQVARELYAEGDQRFARLRVAVKAWPGDAQVISAHLAENELRGEISFWEKAAGVERFRAECEREQGEALTAAALYRELKKRGLNYGVKTLQNFTFATEHLRAVGPWLQARSVNEVIRPCLAALRELAAKLGQAAALDEALGPVLDRYGQHLAARSAPSEGLAPEDAKPAGLDDRALVADLSRAAAAHLALAPDAMQRMLEVLQLQPRIGAGALREAGARRPVFVAAQGRSASDSVVIPEQAPLAGMLAGVRTAGAAPASRAGSAVDPVGPGSGVPPERETVRDAPDATRAVLRQLEALNAIVPLHEVLVASPVLPFGYLVDFPPIDLGHADGKPLQGDWIALRIALWKLLAALSCQYDQRVIAQFSAADAAQIRWIRSARAGREAFVADVEARVGDRRGGARYLLGLDELPTVLNAPAVGEAVAALMAAMVQVRRHAPESVPEGFRPLFAN